MSLGRILQLTILGICSLCVGCGGRAYLVDPVDSTGVQDRAESQIDGTVRAAAAVPGRQETAAIFGIDLYDQGIQPVWLQIENNGSEPVRYAMVSTDSDYFSPLEVAYKNRGGFSDVARKEMEQRLSALAMPRYIGPGETRSGFVFTHADRGAKGFNVDVFSSGDSMHFTYLLRVPGFVPDYANIDFNSIYTSEQLAVVDEDELHLAVRNLPCCSTDADNAAAGAINFVLVGAGDELLRTLLRSRWIETSVAEAADEEPSFLFGRQQDGIFSSQNSVDDSSYEMRLWLAPIVSGEDRVWVGQVRHFFAFGSSLTRIDPDADYARHFALQSLVYGQSVEKLGWVAGTEIVPATSFWNNFVRPDYFTDGDRVVLWLSSEPFSTAEITTMNWDESPNSNR